MNYYPYVEIQSAKVAQKYELDKQLSFFILTFAEVCKAIAVEKLSCDGLL